MLGCFYQVCYVIKILQYICNHSPTIHTSFYEREELLMYQAKMIVDGKLDKLKMALNAWK